MKKTRLEKNVEFTKEANMRSCILYVEFRSDTLKCASLRPGLKTYVGLA